MAGWFCRKADNMAKKQMAVAQSMRAMAEANVTRYQRREVAHRECGMEREAEEMKRAKELWQRAVSRELVHEMALLRELTRSKTENEKINQQRNK